ncbi:hypothetical protein F1544_13195 [Kineosporiaceae bacterium B12]|nr:hypothetical protein [Kineococcus rubinsiae]
MGEPAPRPEDRFTHVEVTSEQELHDRLLAHHAQQEAVWLVTWKKAVPDRYVTHEQVLDQLVAFGWIDGIRRRIDDERSRQLVSPRRTRPWARSYQVRAERLTAEGRMHPAGLAGVVEAKRSGAWDAMADVDDLVVPEGLAAALRERSPAEAFFAAFPPSTRRNVLRWIASAKTPATRAKRIALTAEDARHDVRVRSNG